MFLSAIPAVLNQFNGAIMICLGGIRVMDGILTMGSLVSFQALMGSFTAPVMSLLSMSGQIQELKGTVTRLDDVLRNPVDPQLTRTPPPIPRFENVARLDGYVELRNLTFGYSRLEKPLIVDFNLTLRPGQRVAIIGGSGSGKSTVARLICGLFEPWEGEVLFDGVPRKDLPRRLINDSVALVDQEIVLFEGTMRDNITMWDSSVSDATLLQAAKDAEIHETITGVKGGYEYKVEEGGRNFSGGQRQRIEIARSLCGNPRLLVLDEATSALDSLTELEVGENIRRRGCTCILIAHRLSTIRDCDEIIVLERGKIVQRGTHESMMAVDGPYSHLIVTT
jgi:ABC-type bacteriocin/lantibiotic exporter with double-glycine peptidase domain